MFITFKKNTIYIQITPDLLSVRHVESKTEINDKPLIAVDKDRKILAIGREAENIKSAAEVIDGFSHPRSFIYEPMAASETLKGFIQKLLKDSRKSIYVKKPIVIFHPQGNTEGGLTGFEKRGLRDMGELVKSSKTYIWVGRELTDHELKTLNFPESEGTVFAVKT